MKLRKKHLYLILALITIIPLFFFSWCYWVMETLPVARADLEKIELNMSKETVESILGPSADIANYSEGERWRYSKSGKWIMIDIQFNSQGKVKKIEIDR